MMSIRGNLKSIVVRATHRRASPMITGALLLVATLLAFVSYGACAGELDTVIAFDIHAQTLDKALLEFGVQANVQISFEPTPVLRGTRVEELKGPYTCQQALARLLKGTDLTFMKRGKTIAILKKAGPHTTQTRHNGAYENSVKTSGDPADPKHDSSSTGVAEAKAELREIVVTGTHIVGIERTPSFTSTYGRNYLYSTGAGSIAQFISQLPGNFSEASAVSVASTQGGPAFTLNNNVAAAGIDIHGLGVQSTLVLVNGYRIAPGNFNGGFVDVSMLPLSAVDHIDIVADSASATYGSDAVGGVANIVMLQRFNGEEARLRYGSVTDGGHNETQVSGTIGGSWPVGSVVLSYQYSDSTPLSAANRSFSQKASSPFSLLPEDTSNEVYGSFTAAQTDSVTTSGFLIYGHRDASANFVSGISATRRDGTVDSGVAEVGVNRQFGWGLGTASVEYSANESDWTDARGLLPNPENYSLVGETTGTSRLGALDIGLSGRAGRLGRRSIRYAAGAQLRKEGYSYSTALLSLNDSRTVASEYAELWIPILESLDGTLDDRNEHYSDFGSTNNAKLGLIWRPRPGVVARATYSTAFRAPSLYQLLNIDQAAFTPVRSTAASGACGTVGPGCTSTLVLFGGNPALSAEKAKTWTAGVDLSPQTFSGMTVGLSFYDIKYYHRINTASSAINIFNSLEADEDVLGSALVRTNVQPQEIQQLAALAIPKQTFVVGGVVPNTVTTLIDTRAHNLAALSTRGVDFRIAYAIRKNNFDWTSELSGTRIIQYMTQFSPLTPEVSALNTTYNPLKLRARLRESVAFSHFYASVFTNYAGAYANTGITPPESVSSWTTIDASIGYASWLGSSKPEPGWGVTLGVFNLINKEPPYVKNPSFPVNFDGVNASAIGRLAYAELRVVL